MISYPFQQNNNLLYLTGFNEPDCCLIISKGSDSGSDSFFVTSNDKNNLLWSGPRAGIEGAKEIFGFQNTFDIKKLNEAVEEICKAKGNPIFIDYDPEHSSLRPDLYEKVRLVAKPVEPLLRPLRLVKDLEEQELLKKSGKIASEAFKQTMIYSKKARNEAELAAFMEFQVRSLGGERLAYVPVVAGANRGLVLHYTHNNQQLNRETDWMLMDSGAHYFGYCSDITRSWPLSGKFSEAQGQLYEAVLNVQKGCQAALETIKNISFSQFNEVACYLTAMELDKLGFKDVERNVNKWFPHSIGHHLGLDLHDCPQHDPNHPLVPGNVITIEPGVYVQENDLDAPETFRGLAIRIEDDFIIGCKGGLINMTEGVPKTISDVETLFNQKLMN